ncbi:ADP-ribosylglycohydrolase family protein [Spirosoma sp. KCTC 42546]|uniref:ADP-ribosylglycohydrolase family protein n=1 Tax=Spirosoma sp. KCTC 42546 TaxID=2520506 RepID=UPI00115B0BAF|nr:ADP-ribosylglycohydrolase family protein [Spirosoma sp. KCTC 42546]QDK82245.1 ADP-ribosylglycohydrolase family protein [Spirosoma sp. KCTC 42546]
MKFLYLSVLALLLSATTPPVRPAKKGAPPTVTLSKNTIQDKIKGGWAGQVIGCTFGGPTEFRFTGTMINAYQPIPWYDGYIKKTMTDIPGLYDDLYMDLTFVDVFEKKGLDAPVAEHANAYAKAEYMLWHANQAGRYNLLNGMKAPESGHWLNNPHADDIDFQIEADFSGLMSPGMPNTAVQIGDPIGHIMNYGDGWYGGAYVGAMYSLAFVSKDVNYIVKEALKTIPAQSTFYQCIADVIKWHDQFPNDWKRTWFEIERKWADEVGCPDGVFHSFNIDAKINSAYIVLGLLYGEGDFTKTMEISTRAGQDSDCNPASAGGILGTMLGYDQIPAYWKQGLKEAEDIDFKYTTMSLNDVYAMSMKHALQVVERNGGKINGDQVTIALQTPKAVRLEQAFTGHYPVLVRGIHKEIDGEYSFDFEGTGFVLKGEAKPKTRSAWDAKTEFVFTAELSIDDKKIETAKLPADFTHRRHELFWRYQLPKGKHTVRIKVLNPDAEHIVRMGELIVYSDQPVQSKLR